MRVLHVIPSISPLRGGPSAAVLAMVAALRRRGVDAAILTSNDNGPGVDPSLPLGEWCERQGAPVLAFPRWSPPLRPLREFAVTPGLNRWLASNLHGFQLLHVHALFSWPSTTAMAQARRAGVPYVLRPIGQLNHWSLRRSAGRKRLLLRLIERRNLASAAALHFTSEAERDQAAALGLATPSFVLPLGVEAPADLPAGPPAAPPTVFLFLSRLHPKKQLEQLLEALALLQRRQPAAAWELRVAGDGDPAYVAGLQERARRLGLTGHCRWLGFLEGEAKWQALRQAHWFVLPSASENFGIAAVEALAAGTPVILSPEVAVAPAVAQAGAGLICSSDPSQLAAALDTALAGPGEPMRAAARSLALSRYGWAGIAEHLEHTYAALIR
ncbi:glycosyltransferase [Cyanobium sp. CH-040]|uniref:glycosyltransferase n=1 Tax=Cyanobium sp. CH-040 TaxID=2823708 RepID=UPI0020CE1BD7|nr:glycosyltransferase [Cyanobium sp. CH-040]MCP9927894.1 glycosyltransferase [Cyanobium sp. CH-040]